MMNEARPFASLSSGLLARKGSAKPAMRPQGFGPGAGFDDLGWNDMGGEPIEEHHEDDRPEHVPSSIAALTPAPKPARQAGEDEPEVIAQQRAIAESFERMSDAEPEAAFEPEPVAAAPARREAPAEIVTLPKRAAPVPVSKGRKAAFTLRLDGGRHLRLRLATAVSGRSAQQLVTEALDQLLASIPEIEALAERVPASGAKRS
jgi:hypothetical protein